MPVRFACEHCGQVLSVTRRKIGARAKCPKCKGVITVPTEEAAAAMMADQQPDTDEAAFDEFVVYDDMELVYETDEPHEPASDDDVDLDRVAVPRSVLYMQGVLLAVVAVVAFAFGVMVGSASKGPGEVADQDKPAKITGNIAYAGAGGRPSPDDGCVVIVVPEELEPEEKIQIEGLRPDEPTPPDDHQALAELKSLGGAYTRADPDGQFSVQVPKAGMYYVLVVSRNTLRSDDELPKVQDLVQLGQYFLAGNELIGPSRYQWTLERVKGAKELEVVFTN